MTVNGVDVPKSEFEYLYHKNSQQQMAPQPINEYVEMFVNYRLKVADACAAGIDTTSAFRQEMSQYRHDLAAPYMADSVYLNRLVSEAYDRSREEVSTSHIMFFKTPSAEVNAASRATLDSLNQRRGRFQSSCRSVQSGPRLEESWRQHGLYFGRTFPL